MVELIILLSRGIGRNVLALAVWKISIPSRIAQQSRADVYGRKQNVENISFSYCWGVAMPRNLYSIYWFWTQQQKRFSLIYLTGYWLSWPIYIRVYHSFSYRNFDSTISKQMEMWKSAWCIGCAWLLTGAHTIKKNPKRMAFAMGSWKSVAYE